AVTENGTLSSTGTIAFNDVDLIDSHTVSVASAEGNLGGLTASVSEKAGAANGSVSWSYSVDDAAVQYLAAGETKTETFTVTLDDGNGGTVDQTVSVVITGTNDAAVLGSATISLTEADTALSTSGTLTISDIDHGEAHFVAQNGTAGQYGSFSVDADGAWSYQAGAHNELAANQVVSDSFTVAAADGTTTSVTVTLTGTNDAAVLSSATAALTETNAALSASGQLTISDVDSAATFVAQSGTAGQYGSFSVDANGAWSYQAGAHNELAANQVVSDSFTVAAADGTTTSVTVTLTGTNDAAVLSSATAALTETNAA
ncbi:type I secretion protein, partial [Paramagnetospirillum kuznetsovii]